MSRKHFIAIAETIKFSQVDAAAKKQMATDLAKTLAGTNPAFNRERFLDACGVQ